MDENELRWYDLQEELIYAYLCDDKEWIQRIQDELRES